MDIVYQTASAQMLGEHVEEVDDTCIPALSLRGVYCIFGFFCRLLLNFHYLYQLPTRKLMTVFSPCLQSWLHCSEVELKYVGYFLYKRSCIVITDHVGLGVNAIASVRPSVCPFVSTVSSELTDC